MTEQCAVSILVPVCNVERYLRECLESLMAQTLESLQIICIDDGSTDSSLGILNEFARLDTRFEIITKPNSGYGNSMNLGLQKARGRYIGIVESDDFIEPDMFEKLLDLAEKHQVDVVKSNFFEHETHNDPKRDPLYENLAGCTYGTVLKPVDDYAALLIRPAIWSGLYRADFLKSNDIVFLETPGASFQDTSFNYKVFAAAERALLVEDAYLHYRIDNSNSSVKSQKKVFCICDEYEEMWRFTRERGLVNGTMGKLLPQIQFGGYKWNLDRLTPKLQHSFYERMIEEFSAIEREGLLDRAFFNDAAWNDLTGMLADPEGYFLAHYGPINPESTVILYFHDGDRAFFGACLDAARALANPSSEIIGISRTDQAGLNAVLEEKRTTDGRVFTPDEVLSCQVAGLVDLEQIRTKRIVSLCPRSTDARGFSLDARAFFEQDGTGNPTIQTVHLVGSTIDTAALASRPAPLFVPLLASGFYHVAQQLPIEASCYANFDEKPTLADYQRVSRAIEELGPYANEKLATVAYETVRSFHEAIRPLWNATRSAYRNLDEKDRREIPTRLSPSLFEPAITPLATRQNPAEAPKTPDVSVIVPVYNAESFLEECLGSILSQEGVSLEVVCVNDSSPDNSLAILEELARKDTRVIVVTQQNGGAGSARNRGIDLARGRYLAFMDSDDLYPATDTLFALVQAAEENDVALCGGSFSMLLPDGQTKERFTGTIRTTP